MRSRLAAVVFATAMLAALALAPSAGAVRSVVGHFPVPQVFPQDPHSSTETNGVVAVADSGSARPSAGDTYVGGSYHCSFNCVGKFADAVGGFIKQFSPDGALERAWGTDVVASGPDNSNETQAVQVGASGGSFTLSFGGDATGPIAWDATPGQVQSALNGLASISVGGGSVTVGGGAVHDASGSSPYLVSFDGGPLAGVDQPLLVVDGSSLTGSAAVYTTSPGGGGFEVCDPSIDTCQAPFDDNTDITLDRANAVTREQGGRIPGSIGIRPEDVAVNQDSGDVYVLTSFNRINRYSASGRFISAFGLDVVRRGPDDSNVDEIQKLTVNAASGSYKLGLRFQGETQSTALIPFNASAAQVKAALEALPYFQENGGSVTVSGSYPTYTIHFDGAFGGDSFDQLTTSPGSAGSVTTLQDGGGPEVCTVNDACKIGSFPSEFANQAGSIKSASLAGATGIAVAPPGAPNAGDVLANGGFASPHVSEFSATGQFTRSFGWDVVDSGPDQAGPSDQQQVALGANTTGGSFTLTLSFQTTASIPSNASAGQVQSALNALSSIGGAGGTASVGGPDGGPWTITFGGTMAGDDVPQMSAGASGLTVSSGAKSATVSTLVGGGAFEVCHPAVDACGAGSSGAGLGQLGNSNDSRIWLAEGPDGTIYTADPENGRVQRFVPAGSGFTPAATGVNEIQRLTINATGGQFRLTGVAPRGAAMHSSEYPDGSSVLTNVTATKGQLEVGQRVYDAHVGTAITAINGNTVTLSFPQRNGCFNSNCNFDLSSPVSSSDLPFNASAAQVKAAIESLPPLSDDGSTVSVSGPDGGPFTITYDGGPAPGTDFPQFGIEQGSLSGGSGPDAGQATLSVLGDGGPNGHAVNDIPEGVAVEPDGNLLVLKNVPEFAARCPAGFPIELSLGVQHEGDDSTYSQFRIQELSADGHTLVGSSPACNTDPGYFDGDPLGLVEPTTLSVDPTGGDGYSLAPTTFDGSIADLGVTIWGEVGSEPELALDPVSGLGPSGVTLSGTIDPNGAGPIDHPNPSLTRYRAEYRKAGASDWTTYASGVPVGSGSSPVSFNVGISGLDPNTTYEARIVAIKPFGFAPVTETTAPFTTSAGKPRIDSRYFDHLDPGAVDLHTSITPGGADTTYHFEYGPTTDYGQSTAPLSIGDGSTPVAVQAHLSGLDPVLYHFRVVATNSEGTATSADQTFHFYPESCPNEAARQQTNSSQLPDCRAYELVSPGQAGTITLMYGAPNSPLASSPSRFSYFGQFGVLPGGSWNPSNNFPDAYVATRTASGWRSSFVGVQQNELGDPIPNPGSPLRSDMSIPPISLVGDDGLDGFLQWALNSSHSGFSSAPYRFDAQGNDLGRLPTNLDQIPGGDADIDSGGFLGDELLSGDGRVFFYSSANVAMATGGLTAGPGSVYRNDIDSGQVQVVSKNAAGDDIPAAPGSTNAGQPLLIAGAAQNGSHVLISAPVACGPLQTSPAFFQTRGRCSTSPGVLYMNVDGSHSYDVSRGQVVDFAGMTRDGSRVFFTTAEQMPGTGDTDSSVDLFMWSEQGDTLTRLSAGAGSIGDSDACNASWIAGCGVQVVPKAAGIAGGAPQVSLPVSDNATAASADGAYFYSPEQFVGSEGVPGHRNLYVYLNGKIHFVASLDSNEPATRIQVSADGRFGAFTTRSQLTKFDNTAADGECFRNSLGHSEARCLEMYRFDAQDDQLVCVSCDPGGAQPNSDVEGSRSGIFLTDDGRAFFATADPLVARDGNGGIDVYEYVEGRPQLITTGTESPPPHNGFNSPIYTQGLAGVSADGADVYFATKQSLVAEDENGEVLKFYDARTNGGFASSAPILPCAAADECHGPGSQAPAATSPGTLKGSDGNLPSPKHHKPKRKHKHHKRKHKHHKRKHKHHKRHGKRAATRSRVSR